MTCHCETNVNDLVEFCRDDLEVAWGRTQRGFMLGEFRDLYGQDCSIQESSLATVNAIWFGVGGCRMHLTVDQVRGLVAILTQWTESELPLGPVVAAEQAGTGEGE